MKAAIKILVVNPNTTVAVTRGFVAEARVSASSGTVIDGVTGTFGAAIVSTQAENVVAAHSALDLLATHAAGYDAAILAISFDSALDAAREVMAIPVVGITQAAMVAACARADRIGLVTFGAVSGPLYDELVRRYGLSDRIAGIETIEATTTARYLDTTGRDDAVHGAAMRLAAAGAGAIVVCGAAVAGIARRLRPLLPIPILDGAAPAVAAALDLASRPVSSRPFPRPLALSTGLSPALAALIAGPADASSPATATRKE